MIEKGWEPNAPGSYAIPSDQSARFDVDSAECEGPEQDIEDLRLSSDEAGEVFDAYLLLNDCLEENGFPVTEPPMSREVFVEQTVERIIPPWTPWDDLPIGDEGPAEAACPAADFGLGS